MRRTQSYTTQFKCPVFCSFFRSKFTGRHPLLEIHALEIHSLLCHHVEMEVWVAKQKACFATQSEEGPACLNSQLLNKAPTS
jgi:hypothetical protein